MIGLEQAQFTIDHVLSQGGDMKQVVSALKKNNATYVVTHPRCLLVDDFVIKFSEKQLAYLSRYQTPEPSIDYLAITREVV